ncbi:MAG: hypothetical protein ABFS21_01485 [Actinomycetota bacterium]
MTWIDDLAQEGVITHHRDRIIREVRKGFLSTRARASNRDACD